MSEFQPPDNFPPLCNTSEDISDEDFMRLQNKLVRACLECKGPMCEHEDVVNYGICNFCFDKGLEEYELFSNVLTSNWPEEIES